MNEMAKKEQAMHALGGIGHNLIYALFSGYLLIFYTDVFQLSPKFLTVLFLVARIWDAINDPMMGVICDRTHSKMGRYRIWLLRAAPVIAISLILCFYVPNLSAGLAYVYAFVTYILLGMSFTAADIPYWTLPSVMTGDAEKRNNVFSSSSIVASLASGVGAVAVPAIVSAFPEQKTGYLVTAIIFAVIGIITYSVTALNTQERVEPERKEYSLKLALTTLFQNKPLLIVMGASVFGNLAFQLKVGMNTYYGTYTLGDYNTVTLLSAMLLVGMLIGAGIVPKLIKTQGQKKAMLITLLAGAVFSAVYWIAGYKSLPVVLVFSVLTSIVVGAFTVLINSMTADTIDYAELKFGQRNEGIITSTRTFITKLATAVAGVIVTLTLEFIHYIPNVEQTTEVKQTFHNLMSLIPALFYLVGFLIFLTYPLTKEKFAEMEEKLKEKREKT
ncbi:MAG: glycoside-pentoside-hexuronide (GPH):cation symporter [Bulleidia sp.]|nr:glycoside-pentoside-hexuronide (GPH):cation symporter [Bulleidia sp.]